MARVKTIRGQKRLNGSGPRTQTGGQAVPRDVADVSAVNGGQHLNYYLSTASFAVAKEWTAGCDVEWDMDDDPEKPVVVHLTPAAGRGFTLRQPLRHHRPHFVLPTGDVGIPAAVVGLNVVKEVAITDARISIEIPFALRRPNAPAETELTIPSGSDA